MRRGYSAGIVTALNGIGTPADGDTVVGSGGRFILRYAKPPGLPALPIPLNAETIPGAPRNAKEAFERLPGYNPTRIYVASYGSAANPGTDLNAPTTLDYALHTSTLGSHIVCVDDLGCATAPLDPAAITGGLVLGDLRNTNASQASDLPKMLDANGQNIIFRGSASAGVTLSSATWANDVTLTNCWTSTLALAGSASFTRVLRTDKLDDEGLYWPFRQYTSAAALNSASAGNGYYWDSVAKKLWLRIAEGTSVEAFKTNLLGLFLGSLGTARINAFGASLCLVGVRTEGVELVTSDLGATPTRLPRLYLHQCQILWSHNKGYDPTQVGEFVASDTLLYSSRFDNANYFASSVVAKGLGQMVRVRSLRAGDMRTFPLDESLQGVSCHGGSNSVNFSCEFRENNGQQLADGNIDNSFDTTWCVDCTFVGGNPGGVFDGVFPNVNIGTTGVNSSRTAWFDNCRSYCANTNGDLQIEGTGALGIVRTYNTTFATQTVLAGASAPTPYTPGVF